MHWVGSITSGGGIHGHDPGGEAPGMSGCGAVLIAAMGAYGMHVGSPLAWAEVRRHPQLVISVEGGEGGGPTRRYHLSCWLKQTGRDGGPLEWEREVTLVDFWGFKNGLRNRVDESLYEQYFSRSPFPLLTGPKGTTGQLGAWLVAFCAAFNARQFDPTHTWEMLCFLGLPVPEPSAAEGAPEAGGALQEESWELGSDVVSHLYRGVSEGEAGAAKHRPKARAASWKPAPRRPAPRPPQSAGLGVESRSTFESEGECYRQDVQRRADQGCWTARRPARAVTRLGSGFLHAVTCRKRPDGGHSDSE